MTASSTLGILLGLLSAAIFGVAAVVQAKAVRGFETSPDRLGGFLARAVRSGAILLVVVAYLAGFVLHAAAIWLLPLYLAQALVAMSLPVAAVFSTRVEEALTRGRWASVALVTLGLVLLSAGAGEPGEVVTTPLFSGLLWAGVAMLALTSLFGRHVGGTGLGLLAGLGYAGSAISVRGVTTPVEPVVVAAALAVPSFSVVAFWLYSLGMRRTAVPAATASMIVAQTFVPAAIGVTLLGDGVRDGWWPAVAAGLVLATLGATVLGIQVRSLETAATVSSPGPAR